MKLRRLPEIELANVLLMERRAKKAHLTRFARGRAFWSYDPARRATATILNAQTPLGLALKRVPDEEIIRQIKRACTHPKQLLSCVEVVRLLMGYRDRAIDRAVERRFPTVAIGRVGTVRFADNLIYQESGRSFVPFLDHRRGSGLTQIGRLGAFSMMHQSVRVPDPDMSDVDLAIIQFAQAPGRVRTYQVHRASALSQSLLTFDELQEAIEETHLVWLEVQQEEAARRGQATPDAEAEEAGRQWRFKGF